VRKLQAYNFGIKYVKGKHNVVVDVLSRRPATLSLISIAPDWRAQLLVECSKDRFACEVLDGLVINDWYKVMNKVIYFRDRIYSVPNSQLREKILHAAQDSPLAMHQVFTKTYRAIRERFAWRGLKDDVLRHIRECNTCQWNKGEQSHPSDLLQPLPIPKGKWESI